MGSVCGLKGRSSPRPFMNELLFVTNYSKVSCTKDKSQIITGVFTSVNYNYNNLNTCFNDYMMNSRFKRVGDTINLIE